MTYNNFSELTARLISQDDVKKVVVVAAQDEHTLESVFRARENKIVEPVLVGDREMILSMLEQMDIETEGIEIIQAESDTESAAKAVKLVREGKANFILKGKLQTSDLLREVVDKETGLRTGSVMSHLAILELPGYHKLLAITDGGMMVRPGVEDKKKIIENAVRVFRNMGYENPKVAILSAVETVNNRMPESVDAHALKQMNLLGEITECLVEGPISYDLAMSRESADIKGYQSMITEDVDILLVPDIAAGNILSKALIYSAGAKMAGMVIGARVPIALTSRGSTAEEKYLSIALCASAAK